MNKAKSKSSLRPRCYTEYKDYIKIPDKFQKANEKLTSLELPQIALYTPEHTSIVLKNHLDL